MRVKEIQNNLHPLHNTLQNSFCSKYSQFLFYTKQQNKIQYKKSLNLFIHFFVITFS